MLYEIRYHAGALGIKTEYVEGVHMVDALIKWSEADKKLSALSLPVVEWCRRLGGEVIR